MLKTQTIRIAHSPDSDDAFMFYAIKHKKINLKGYKFEFASDEIEALNQAAINTLSGIESPYDIFAVSFHAYHYLKDKYAFLKSGASMAGKDYGPRLVTKAGSESVIAQSKIKIAVPGKYTSAFLVLQLWLKEQALTNEPEFIFCSYNDVFPLLESNQVNASLLIHESQLKFQEQGYQLIVDLGKWWYDTKSLSEKLPDARHASPEPPELTDASMRMAKDEHNNADGTFQTGSKGLRMPLGTNVVRRDLGAKFIADFDALLKESIEWGLNNFDEVLAYSRKFANNELDDTQAQRYINMYVDESTVQLTENDLKSVELLLAVIN